MKEELKESKNKLREIIELCKHAQERLKKEKIAIGAVYFFLLMIIIVLTVLLAIQPNLLNFTFTFFGESIEMTWKNFSIILLVLGLWVQLFNVFKNTKEHASLKNFIKAAENAIADNESEANLSFWINDYKTRVINSVNELDEYSFNKSKRNIKAKTHQIRMVIRKKIIKYGTVIMICIAFYLALWVQWEFLKIIVLEIILGYILMMVEYFAYQYLLYKDNLSFHRGNYSQCIEEDKVSIKTVLFLARNVLKMIKSRNEDYLLILNYFVVGFSVLSIIFSLLDMFRVNLGGFLGIPFYLENNNSISVFMIMISIIITLLQWILIKSLNEKIDIINLKLKIVNDYNEVSEENKETAIRKTVKTYNSVQLRIEELDMARGRHELAVDMFELNKKINRYVLYTFNDRMETHKGRLRMTWITYTLTLGYVVLWNGMFIDKLVFIIFFYFFSIFLFMYLFNRFINEKYAIWCKDDAKYREQINLNAIDIDYIKTGNED